VLIAAQVDKLEHFGDALADHLIWHLLEAKTESDVFKYIQMRKQGVLLENGVNLPLIRWKGVDFFPIKKNVPAFGSTKPPMMRRVVVLPHPDGPKSVTNS
jgi:hypothetical protein